ncbi:MAG: hypothetical protein ACT4PU_03965 [Planctomycetota bacterium]
MSHGARRALLFLGMVGAGLVTVQLLADPLNLGRVAVIGDLPRDGTGGRLNVRDKSEDISVVFGEVTFDITSSADAGANEAGTAPAYRVHILSGRPDASGAFLAVSPTLTALDKETGLPRGSITAREARFQGDETSGDGVSIDFGRLRVRDFSLIGTVRGSFQLSDGTTAHMAAERFDVLGDLVTAPGQVSWATERMHVVGQQFRWDRAAGVLEYEADVQLKLLGEPQSEFLAPGGLRWTTPASGPLAAPVTAVDVAATAASSGELRGGVRGQAADGSRLSADTLFVNDARGELRLVGQASLEREAGPSSDVVQRLTAHTLTVFNDAEGVFRSAEALGAVRLERLAPGESPAWLSCDSLLLIGDLASTASRVDFGRGDLLASGLGLSWNLQSGQFQLLSAVEFQVAPASEHPLAGLQLVAPAGLSWLLPQGANSAARSGHGELRGGVTGGLPDGSTLAAQTLTFDGDARLLVLDGGAEFVQPSPGGVQRLAARLVRAEADPAGGLAFASAEGEARWVRGPAGPAQSRLTAEHLERKGLLLQAQGPVRWEHEGFEVTGLDLSWDEATGRVILARKVRLSLRDPARARDLQLLAEGGLSWLLPAGAAQPALDGQGELRGPVTGTSSDGSLLRAQTVRLDGPSRTLTLLGAAQLELAGAATPTTITSEELVVRSFDTEPTVFCPTEARWEHAGSQQGPWHGQGVGLSWDSAARHLSVARDAWLAFPGARENERWELWASAGLDWWMPLDESGAPGELHGELRGEVRGRSDQGGSLATQRLLVQGRQLSLFGVSSWIAGGAEDSLGASATESLVMERDLEGLPISLEAVGSARITIPSAPGVPPTTFSAERIERNAAERSTTLLGQARVERPAYAGHDALQLSATESLSFLHDEQDALLSVAAAGRVSFRSSFVASGDTFSWDLAADLAQLSGNCQLAAGGVSMTAAAIEIRPQAETFRILRSRVRLDD